MAKKSHWLKSHYKSIKLKVGKCSSQCLYKEISSRIVIFSPRIKKKKQDEKLRNMLANTCGRFWHFYCQGANTVFIYNWVHWCVFFFFKKKKEIVLQVIRSESLLYKSITQSRSIEFQKERKKAHKRWPFSKFSNYSKMTIFHGHENSCLE